MVKALVCHPLPRGGGVEGMQNAGVPRFGCISDHRAESGIIIASLVVRADTGMPGEGYFHFAEADLGRKIDDPRAFWLAEAERVWTAYAGRAEEAVRP